jgi:anti-sigma B factor antagonist
MPVQHGQSSGGHERELAQLQVDRRGDQALVGIEGELDMSNAGSVHAQLRAAAAGCRLLTVDLSRLAFIDSAGISVLVRLANGAADAGFTLAIDAPPDSLAGRTLALTGLDRVLPLIGTTDAGEDDVRT